MKISDYVAMSKHLVFIHIPKTAGTSFRKAAEQYYGKEHIFYDYSPSSSETSPEIVEKIYNDDDLYAFSLTFKEHMHMFLAGHFPVAKYYSLFETQNVISFVRNPVAQVISHFNHYTTYHNYTKSIEEFILEPRFQNIQSRLLLHKPLGLFGFLGITEQYEDSIALFNAAYGTDFAYLHNNKKQEGTLSAENLDRDLLKKIEDLNRKDIVLYDAVCQQFETRKKLHRQNQPYTYGFIQSVTDTTLKGCAFQAHCDDAVDIEIYHNDQCIAEVKAKDYRPGLLNQGVPRKGFIGFEYDFGNAEINAEEIRVVVKRTGQVIR